MNDKKITRLTASVEIDRKPPVVWQQVKSFGNIYLFHPMVKYSHSTNELQGIGAKRHCQLVPMGTMEEVITEWAEGQTFTSEVYDGKMLPPWHFMKGKLQLEGVGNKTKVTFTLIYQMKFGLLGQIMNQFLVKPQFKKAPVKYLQGLKNYMESNLR